MAKRGHFREVGGKVFFTQADAVKRMRELKRKNPRRSYRVRVFRREGAKRPSTYLVEVWISAK